MTLQDDVSALKDGDYVRAVFKYSETESSTQVGYVYFATENGSLYSNIHSECVTRINGKINVDLISIEPFARPLPPEPEVGSFVLLKDGHIAQFVKGTIAPDWIKVTSTGYQLWSWKNVHPQIVKMWDKDGNEVAL